MHDELTTVDIQKMKNEIAERTERIGALLAEVKRTREMGDLSENDEYRSAKRELGRNRSRIRHLKAMIETAIIIDPSSPADVAGLFDEITLVYEDGKTVVVRFVTSLRNNVFGACFDKETPFAKAILGHKVGDTVAVTRGGKPCKVTITKIVKKEDDASLPISSY